MTELGPIAVTGWSGGLAAGGSCWRWTAASWCLRAARSRQIHRTTRTVCPMRWSGAKAYVDPFMRLLHLYFHLPVWW